MGLQDFLRKMMMRIVSGECVRCDENEAQFRCTRCDRKYCRGCIEVFFGELAARTVEVRDHGVRAVITFGSEKIYDAQGRAFCPDCYGALLDRVQRTGQWVVQSQREHEPSCEPLEPVL